MSKKRKGKKFGVRNTRIFSFSRDRHCATLEFLPHWGAACLGLMLVGDTVVWASDQTLLEGCGPPLSTSSETLRRGLALPGSDSFCPEANIL